MNRARLFPNSVTLVRFDWIESRGARVPGPAAVETSTRAAVQPIRADRRAIYDAPSSLALYSVYLPADPGLGEEDQIRWNGRTLRVLAPARDQAGRGLVWAIDCAERESEASR